MKLFKLAALDKESELSKVRSDTKKIRGVFWQAMGRDPGPKLTEEILVRCAEKLASMISERIPTDVDGHFAGQAVAWLAKQAYKIIQAEELLKEYVNNPPSEETIEIVIADAFGGNPADIKTSLENFYKNKRHASRAGYSADLPSYSDLNSFWHAGREITEWVRENIKDDSVWKKQVVDKKDEALNSTTRIHGDMVEPPRKGKGIDADDLINGRLDQSEWTVVIPKSKDAACYWGSGTEWCTAHPDDNFNYYDNYSKEGDLIIFINSRTGNRYQFHFQSNQFMNSADEELSSSVLRDELFDFAESFKDKLTDFKPNKKSLRIENEELIQAARPLFVNKNNKGYLDSVGDAPAMIEKNEIRWYNNGTLSKSVMKAQSGSIRYSTHKPNGEVLVFSNGTFSSSRGGKEMHVKNPVSTFEADTPYLINEREVIFKNGPREGRKNGFAQLSRETVPWSYFRDGKPLSYNEMLNLFDTVEEIEEAGIQEY